MKYTIQYGGEYMEMDENGLVSRPAIGMAASDDWKVTGAVALNNFGNVIKRYTLAELQADARRSSKMIQWQHRNGNQRVHVTDIDHGTSRTWMSPSHCVFQRSNIN